MISMIALETGKAPSSFFFGIEMGPRCGTRRPRIRRGLVWTRWGILWPCRTYTVRLAEILSKITGLPENENEFTGYGWIIGNFDAIAGTYSVTIFGLGFTQNFELTPAVGQGGILTGLRINPPLE